MNGSVIGLAPEAIDGDFVPHARADVAAVLVGREIVLGRVAEGTHYLQTCALNESGAIVWQCFDGSGTLDEIAADIADVFDVDPEAVSTDVVALARLVGGFGFLVGVEEEVLEIDGELSGIPVGEPFPDFEAEDEAGRRASAAVLSGQRSLLVNWSPTCSFCKMIADDLADLAAALTGNGIEIVLLSDGPRAANRALLDHANLACRLLLQDDEIAPGFDDMGTPVAYLIDEAGNVAEPLAVGAPDVVALARRLAGRSGS
jgi:peroxiredoxin